MDKQSFNTTLSHSGSVENLNFQELEALVEVYPYLQSARALLLKAYKQKESYKYNHFLKATAAFTTDRSVLFDYITSKSFKQNDISKSIKQNHNNLKLIELVDEEQVRDNLIDDKKVQQFIKDTDGVLNPDLFIIKSDEKINIEKKLIDNESKVEAFFEKIKVEIDEITEKKTQDNNSENIIDFSPLEIGKPLEFDTNEAHSFSEWLKITSLKPVQRNDEASSNELTVTPKTTKQNIEETSQIDSFSEKLAIIDKFLESNPKIKPPTEKTPQPKLVDNSDTLEDSLMTETLARIYLEQKNYDKAIQAYKILSLKYPEKSSFFAHQIFLVKALIDKNKA